MCMCVSKKKKIYHHQHYYFIKHFRFDSTFYTSEWRWITVYSRVLLFYIPWRLRRGRLGGATERSVPRQRCLDGAKWGRIQTKAVTARNRRALSVVFNVVTAPRRCYCYCVVKPASEPVRRTLREVFSPGNKEIGARCLNNLKLFRQYYGRTSQRDVRHYGGGPAAER